MRNPPHIWLDYRPVRIGWVVAGGDVADLAIAARFNTCLWGGRHNCLIPVKDAALADHLVRCFGVDILLPLIAADDAATTFINGFPHLKHHRWHESMFHDRNCEFADIRHPICRIVDDEVKQRLVLPVWQDGDPLASAFAVILGAYPTPTDQVPDYKAAIHETLRTREARIAAEGPIPTDLLGSMSPLAVTGYDLKRGSQRSGWLGPGVVLGSVDDFDALLLFWNLRAAGAPLIFYDQSHSARLKPYAEAFLAHFRAPQMGRTPHVTFWVRADRTDDDSWRPDLELEDVRVAVADGRDDALWNGMNIKPIQMRFSAWHRDVVPAYIESNGKASASFAVPDRPFDDDVRSLSQKFVVVVDANQHGEPDADFTFEAPFVPRLNEFYGRNLAFALDAVRSQPSRMDGGAIALITDISTQNITIRAFRVFDWLTAFFTLCQIEIARSEAGRRCNRLIAQLGGLQDCRVLKIRGVRNLLRKYSVEQHFTRSGAKDAIRDCDPRTGAAGFDAFKELFIESREKDELTPDDVLRYLLSRRVFRVGVEVTCPNCQLPSWVHLDELKTRLSCTYCDYRYDVTPQLRDRDWRYRRSGIFGRDDDQLGGVPVAITLQQLSSTLHEGMQMYATAVNFIPRGAAIEPCESDFVVVCAGRRASEAPVQIVIGEAKSEGPFDASDVRKLGRLADAVPRELADVFILFSKAGTFSPDEIALARTLNTRRRRRVILWSREELEPYNAYERSKEKLGKSWMSSALTELADNTHALFFSET